MGSELMKMLLPLLACVASLFGQTKNELILVMGHPGMDKYASIFAEAKEIYLNKANRAQYSVTVFGEKEQGNKEAFLEHLTSIEQNGHQPLWIVLLGHGNSFEGTTNFHLRGNDLNHLEFELAFQPIQRPVILIHTGTGSAPFLFAFSGKNRISVSATSSDQEEDFTRMHLEFAKALANPKADLDGDQQTSLFESFLMASKAVQDSYVTDKMIPSEDAIIDDNGDGLGTNLDWFDGLQPISTPDSNELDGLRAHQIYFQPNTEEQNLPAKFIHTRNNLELKLKKLVLKKENYQEEDYLKLLDNRIHQLAQLYIGDNVIIAPENGLPTYREVNFSQKEPTIAKETAQSSENPNNELLAYDSYMNQKDLAQLQEAFKEIIYETEMIHYDFLNSYIYDSRAGHFLDRIGAFWNQYRVSLDAEACFRLRGQGLLYLKAFPELEELNLNYCPINDLDTCYLRYYELKKLALKGTRITDLSFEILKHISSLTHLELGETNVSDACSNYLKNFSLEYLDLSQTNISARSLRNISSCENLQHLNLDLTSIKIEDLIHLKAFKKLKSLKISHLKLSNQQFEDLLKTLPKLDKLSLDKTLLNENLKLQYRDLLSP